MSTGTSLDVSLHSADVMSDHDSPYCNSSGMGSLRDQGSTCSPESAVYEDVLIQSLPKLTQFSSNLDLRDKAVIRPVAFKPLPNTVKFIHSSPILDSLSLSQYSSYFPEDDHRSLTYSVDSCIKIPDTPASCISSKDFEQTPSPSDSGVAELEAMLREKTAEISYLRETLEQNEQVIFKVYEEKEQRWLKEIHRIQALYENKIKSCLHRLAKAEKVVSRQTIQMQEERKRNQSKIEAVEKQKQNVKSENERLQQEVDVLRSKLKEKEWMINQRDGEITVLNSRLKDTGHDTVRGSLDKIKDYDTLRRRDRLEYQKIRQETPGRPSVIDELPLHLVRRELDRLRSEMANTKQELETTRTDIQEERAQWIEEKEKVIRYQKQLHTNYMHVYRKNRRMESELEELTLAFQQNKVNPVRNSSQC